MELIALPLQLRAPAQPGVRLLDGGANIGVVSRHAHAVWFCQFTANGESEIARWRLPGRDGDMHHGFVPGVQAGTLYGLRADGPWEPQSGHRFDPQKLLADPYATRIDRPFVHRSELCLPREHAADSAPFMPRCIVEDLKPVPASSQTFKSGRPEFIYELGVKSFTMRHPGIPPDQRGTLEALANPAVIEHVLGLGVTHVELMPIAAFIDERHLPSLGLSNAWGYNPVCYMALDPRLARRGMDSLRVAVEAFHAAGLSVILDVVFNHTGESDEHGATLSLRGLDNALYFRHACEDAARLVNDTGCGNTLACERPAVQNLVMDTLRHFVRYAGVDGFRFDLATVLGRGDAGFDPRAPLLEAIAGDDELSRCMMIAEPWDVGPDGYRLGDFSARWREWNDRYRDDVRRFWKGESGMTGALATRLAGSSDIFAAKGGGPAAGINFLAAHDGFTLRDLVSYAQRRNHANGEDNRDGAQDNHSWNCSVEGATQDPSIEAARMQDVRALLATLFLSRGTPMLTAGDELGRTQLGNNNAYAQDNHITWLDWGNTDESLKAFVQNLSRLRAMFPTLYLNEFYAGSQRGNATSADIVWRKPDGTFIQSQDWHDLSGLQMTLAALPDNGPALHIVINRHNETMQFKVPVLQQDRSWRLILDSSRGVCASGCNEYASEDILVPARSVCAWMEFLRN